MRKIATVALGLGLVALAACAKPQPKEYVSPAWNFAATFLDAPKVTETKASADGSTPHSLLVESNVGGDDVSVNVVDASSATGTEDQMLDATPDAVAKSMGIDVGAKTYVATGPVNGREVRFDKDGKPVMLMRVFVASKRLYEISANSAKGVSDPNVKRFLDSFRLLTPPPPDPGDWSATSTPAAPATNAPVAPATNAP